MEIANKNSTIEVKEYESYEVMINELKGEGIKNLAIEPSLPFSTYVKFRDDFEIESKTYIDKQRMIKTPAEIEKITKATEIAQKSFLQLDILNNSNSEKEVAFDLVRYMIENGASKESFDTIVTSGANSSLPHAIPEAKKLAQPILIDWGAIYEGYCSDNTRTMVYTERQQEIWDIVAEAHDKAIKAIKPELNVVKLIRWLGISLQNAVMVINSFTQQAIVLVLIFMKLRDFLQVMNTMIERGMVITVEPGIYLEGEFGVRLGRYSSQFKKGAV